MTGHASTLQIRVKRQARWHNCKSSHRVLCLHAETALRDNMRRAETAQASTLECKARYHTHFLLFPKRTVRIYFLKRARLAFPSQLLSSLQALYISFWVSFWACSNPQIP